MAGVKGKGGRPRLSVEELRLRGTYRKDRHAGRAALGVVPVPSTSVADPMHVDAELDGRAWRQAVLAVWAIDDPAGVAVLDGAAVALDRRQALDRLLDGAGGLLARVGVGEVDPAVARVLLLARREADEAFTRAVAALDLEAVPTAVRAGVAS